MRSGAAGSVRSGAAGSVRSGSRAARRGGFDGCRGIRIPSVADVDLGFGLGLRAAAPHDDPTRLAARGLDAPARRERDTADGRAGPGHPRARDAQQGIAGFELCRKCGRRLPECEPRLPQHPPPQHVVAGSADRRADAERDRLADDARAAAHGELLDEDLPEPVGDGAHDRLRKGVRDELAPVGVSGDSRATRLTGELAHEVHALLAEHEGHHQRPCTVGILDGDAVHFGDGLREQGGRLEESGRLDSRERKGHAGADARDDRGRADGRAAGCHRGEIATFENAHDLLGGRAGKPATDAAEVHHDDGPLDREHPVDAALHAVRAGLLGGTACCGACVGAIFVRSIRSHRGDPVHTFGHGS